ncbi:MAG: methyltransferase domain-containing protein [Polyangiaceae bacterium]
MSGSAHVSTDTRRPPRESARFRYDVDLARLPRALRERFLPLELDAETREFIEQRPLLRHGRVKDFLHRALRPLLSDFDLNGLLGTYPLFLLSRVQWERLLGSAPRGSLLDVGAGAGDVTARIAHGFETVVATETSRMMARRLRQRGYRCHLGELADAPLAGRFDVVSCLNVIDRTSRPASLLQRIRELVAENGRLVLATPLPFEPFAYAGGRTLPPEEKLAVTAPRWEEAAVELVERVLGPLGLELESFSRAPYLSGGDPHEPYYVLDDFVVVCRRRPAVT